ncbi:DUF4238 domain-containing protein [Methylobacterium aquaticum]|uniref:DUF4238 domain-containing protein n=1 Tax=Methylobacterium aquaticum TaxID=270351 RepID=UPI0019333AD9|nr:DUF4238 domain-containing protein [Methylobacterium aquaticum]QRE76991.1 DUF4238 domain-containing protein [Methylobacterium aquaticum]
MIDEMMRKMTNDRRNSQKHHYMPVFYLKQWLNKDGQICEYKRLANGAVKPRRTHPSGTGYVRGLYDFVGLEDPELREAFEREFLKPVDTRAAELLQDINAGRRAMNNPEKRSAWTRFLLSLLMRMPEDIKLHKERYIQNWLKPNPDRRKYYKSRVWRPGMPQRLDDVLAAMDLQSIEHRALDALIPLINNPRIGEVVISLHWGSLTLPVGAPALLTSDRPILLSDGLEDPNSHIILPIGPKQIFYAVKDKGVVNFMMVKPPTELAHIVNMAVVSQAVNYVYGQWDVQLPFVQQYMGTNQRPSLIERMQQYGSTQEAMEDLRRKARRRGVRLPARAG